MGSRSGGPSGDLRKSAEEERLSSWMRQAQEGDVEAYNQLLGRLADLARRYVRRAIGFGSGQDGYAHEDVVQEILLAIHAKRHTYEPGRFFLPWFYAISRYKFIDEIRRRTAARRESSLSEELGGEAVLADVGDALDLHALLADLPEKQRTLLRLVKLEGLSVEEASGRTGYSVSDVKVSIHRALKALRKKVEPQ